MNKAILISLVIVALAAIAGLFPVVAVMITAIVIVGLFLIFKEGA